MASLIWLTGAAITALGLWIVFQPIHLSRILHWVQHGPGIYLAAAVRIAIGVVMLVWARDCHRPAIIIIIGILAVLSGMALILLPHNQVQKLLHWVMQRPQWLHRALGLTAMAFGILVIWAGWPSSH
jgi:uncharacterized protein YjeT (DUF2065 family)